MTGNTPTITAAIQLPTDLYSAIANHLHEDKRALRALALTSKVWCAESQRVLFRTFLEEDGVDLDIIHETHDLFLEAIVLNPTLGSYVHTYQQHKMISHPDEGTKHPLWQPASHTWTLTEAALPALVNLKHLCITPLSDSEEIAPLLEFKGCTFSLRTLVWGFQAYDTGRTGPWIEFLRTQHELLHLEIGGMLSGMQRFAWLTDDACPNLRSTSCLYSSPIVHRPRIVGLRISWFEEDPHFDESQVAGLRRLTYLHTPADLTLISALGGIDSNLVLLQLSGWRFKKDRLLPSFPKLRVLVFTEIRSRSEEVAITEDAKTQLVIESFRRCPMLEYIVTETRLGDGQKHYRKLYIPQPVVGASDTAPVIQNEEFIMERIRLGTPWWTAYGV